MLNNRGKQLDIFCTPLSLRLRVHMVVCLLSAFMIRKSRAKSRKKNGHCCNKMPLSFVFCTFQNNIINAKFIQGSVLKNTTWCHNYIVTLCSFKGPSCCDCHMPLAIEMCFSCFSSHWMSNISYWGSQIHLMIFPAHSDGNGACDKTVVLT